MIVAEPPRPPRRVVRGRFLEDFQVGQRFQHHWGRTIPEAEAVQFAADHLLYNPLQLNRVYARAHGFRDLVVSPWYVFVLVLGLSVEDVSEQATALLGYGEMEFGAPVYPGDTLTCESEVLEVRPSSSRPDQGILRVRTWAVNQEGERVISYERTNLIRRRPRGDDR